MAIGIMSGPTDVKNRLTIGCDLVPDTDSGSLFHFHQHCVIRNFRRWISIFYTVLVRTLSLRTR